MPDEAADRPADAGAEPSQDAAAPTAPIPTPPAAGAPAAEAAAGFGEAPRTEPPTAGGTPPPFPPPPPPYGGAPLGAESGAPLGAESSGTNSPPPWFGTGSADGGDAFFSRQSFIRPAEGRYVAGVCSAIGRATNTDPVLWRVVLAVLGFFGGIGILIYLIGWLIIPSEGDTASPIEALLGRGQSKMSPLAVLVLGGATALTFAFIVDNGFRATLLGGAVLVGGALLYKRNTSGAHGTAAAAPTAPPEAAAPPQAAPGATFPFTETFPQAPTTPAAPAAGYVPAAQPTGGATTTGEPVTAPLPPVPPPPTVPPFAAPPPPPPPASGYRPPFAPHGPYAGPQQAWRTAPPPPAKAPKPPKPPKERSKLGRITFFAVLVAIGLVAVLDLGGVAVPQSAYFAAALITIALGLVVGAWLGRARGLIALALLASIGLGISSANERLGVDGFADPVSWQPRTVSGIADRYEIPLGEATLDLRQVDFTGQQMETTVIMHGGQLKVLLPPKVDTVASVDVDLGSATVFGDVADGPDLAQEVTDHGLDGVGGGDLRLTVKMDFGDVEVIR
jgi:phage shock protein PspC (stress-responsive transcriptional regulator)